MEASGSNELADNALARATQVFVKVENSSLIYFIFIILLDAYFAHIVTSRLTWPLNNYVLQLPKAGCFPLLENFCIASFSLRCNGFNFCFPNVKLRIFESPMWG